MYSFDSKAASRGYHVYRNSTWQNAKPGRKVKVKRETNKLSKPIDPYACAEVRNSRVTKSSSETELRKMTSHFELLTSKFLKKFFFRVTNSTL